MLSTPESPISWLASVMNWKLSYLEPRPSFDLSFLQEHIREAKILSKLASSSFDFKPLYAAIAKEGFHSFRVFPIEKVEGNFLDSEGGFALNLFKVVASQLERKWMSILHTFFPRGYNLEAKSNIRCSPRVHKASAMLWRKGSKPSFARPKKKVWVPVNVLPIVFVSLPPPTLPVSEENVHLLMMCNQIVVGSHTFLLTEFLATEITKEGWYSFLLLCLKVSFLLFFSPSIRPRIWFICFCCCLSFLLLVSVLMLAMLYNYLKF
jgi:hypothetical protein